MPKLYLVFNHDLTAEQEKDARDSLGICETVALPGHLRRLWRNVPPDAETIAGHVEPIMDWLSLAAGKGNYVLVQGDFGASFLMVEFAFANGLIPVYATTGRSVEEQTADDGTVVQHRRFKHIRFRMYERLIRKGRS